MLQRAVFPYVCSCFFVVVTRPVAGGGAGELKPPPPLPPRIFESGKTILPKNAKRYHDGGGIKNTRYKVN